MLQFHRPKQPNTTVNFKLDNSKNVYLSNPISTAPDWKAGCGPLAGPGLGALLRPFTVQCVLLRDHKTPGIP